MTGDTIAQHHVSSGYAPVDRQAHDAMRARRDMHAFALRQALAVESEETFEADLRWNAEWVLYQMDVQAGDQVIRIYEGVHRADASRRFLAMWDPAANRATEWQLVQD